MANPRIQIRRGPNSNLPTTSLLAGEPLFTTDNYGLHIATGATTKQWVGAPILDEDAMGSNSATSLATQQSIKAYVDAISTDKISEGDSYVEVIDAGTGEVTIVVDNTEVGEFLIGAVNLKKDTAVTGTLSSSGLFTATLGVKLGNDIMYNSEGTAFLSTDSNEDLEVAGNEMRVNGAGGTLLLKSDVSNDSIVKANTTQGGTNTAGGSLNIYGGQSTGNANGGRVNLQVSPPGSSGSTSNSYQTAVSVRADKSVNFSGDVQVDGDLTIGGTTTTVNSTTVTVDDPLFALADNNSADTVDIGFYGKYVESATTKYCGIFRDASATGDPFVFFDGNQAAPSTTVSVAGTGYDLAPISCGAITCEDASTINSNLSVTGSLTDATIDGGTWS